MCAQMHKWKNSDISIKYFRCDNAVENLSVEKRAENSDWKQGLTLIAPPMISKSRTIWLKYVCKSF